jgi:3-oxoadipate enol-lactonase
VRIKWESQGDGVPLLLVHGLGYTRQGWGPQRALLARRYRVLSYDNRGIGESEVAPGPYTVAQLADDATQVLDAAGVDRAHVVGASLGGMVAQLLAAERPGRVEKLVLAGTTPGGASAFPLPEKTLALIAEASSLPPEVALRLFVENALAAGSPLVDEIFAYRQQHPPDPAGWAAQAAAGAAWDADGRLARISAPTLVVAGTEDAVVDPRNAQLLADAIPGARLELIEGAGHLPFWERAEEFASLVEGFLGGHSRPHRFPFATQTDAWAEPGRPEDGADKRRLR